MNQQKKAKIRSLLLFCTLVIAFNYASFAQIKGKVAEAYCGSTLETEISLVRCNEIPEAVKYSWKFTDTENPEIVLGHTYQTQVKPIFDNGTIGEYGDACEISLAQGPPPSSSIGKDIILECIDEEIPCELVTQAMVYEWIISDGENTFIHQTYYQGSNSLKMSDIEGIQYNTEYSVKVRVEIGSTFSPWGESFTVTTPPATNNPVNIAGKVEDRYNNTTLPTITSLIHCEEIEGAKNYIWQLTDAENPEIKFTRETSEGVRYYRPTWEMDIVLGKSYYVRVKPIFYCGGEGVFGDPCLITLASGPVPSTSLEHNILLACMDQEITCSFVTQAMVYEWEITDGQETITHRTYYHKSNHIYFAEIQGIEYGKTYSVKIRVEIGSTFGSWGETYTVTTPPENSTVVNIGGKVKDKYHNTTLPTITSLIHCEEIEGAKNYIWQLTDAEDPSVTFMRETSEGVLYYRPTWEKNIVLGKSYYVRVKPVFYCGNEGVFGAPCLITIATGPVPSTSIEQDIQLACMDQEIACTFVTQAMIYEWHISDGQSSFIHRTYYHESNHITFNEIEGIQYGKSYSVKVRVQIGSTFGEFGETYTVTTPESPESRTVNISSHLKQEYCGTALLSNLSTVKCEEIPYAESYIWQLTDVESPEIVHTRTGGKGIDYLRPTWIEEIVLGKTYAVKVKPVFSCGREGVYGEACNITLANEEIPLTSIERDRILLSMDEPIECTKITQAIRYEWHISNGDTEIIHNTYFQSSNSITLSEIEGIQYDETYSITVRTEIGSTMSDFGSEYFVKTPINDEVEINTTLDFMVYPSTVVDYFYIEPNDNAVPYSYKLQSIRGSLEIPEQNTEGNKTTVDISGFAEGLYIISIQKGDKTFNRTIYKE